MTSRYHPYRHRRPRWPRTPRTPLDRALDIELHDMLDAIKSEIAAAFRILEEHHRTHPSPRTATEVAILERDQRLRRT